MSIPKDIAACAKDADQIYRNFDLVQFKALQQRVAQLSQTINYENPKEIGLLNLVLDIMSNIERQHPTGNEEEKKSPLSDRIQRSPPFREGVKRVDLRNARQYDMRDTPPACTFHAVAAMKEIAENFDRIFNWISSGDSNQLSRFQKDVILNKGLPLYRRALAQDPKVVEGADFKQVQPFLPQGIHLTQPAESEQLPSFNQRLTLVINHLFAANPPMKTAWIKDGNAQSFAVISNGNRAIFFDSHQNRIIATDTRENARTVLQEKLSPFKQEIGGVDVNPFAYAQGNLL